MKNRIDWKFEDKIYTGFVVWEVTESGIKYQIEHEPYPKKIITEYLETEREFHIPESQQIDDYRVDKAMPTVNETYFRLALNSISGFDPALRHKGSV